MKRGSCLIITLFILTFTYGQPEEWVSRGIGGGGAFFSPVINPFQPEEIFIPSDMTDLFRSADEGLSWQVIPFTELRVFPQSEIAFTSDPQILYTIRFNFADDQFVPASSRNGGATWQELENDPTAGEAFYLEADPYKTDRILLSDYCNIYFSDNGGRDWSTIFNDCDLGAAITGSFWLGDTIVVASIQNLLVSNNGGGSFSVENLVEIPESEGLTSFTGSQEGNQIRLMAVTSSVGDFWPGAFGTEHWGYQGVYVCDFTNSRSWRKEVGGVRNQDHPFFISMARNDINTAYLAGSDSDLFFPIVMKTENGGESWKHVFLTQNNQNIRTGWSGYQGDFDWWYDEVALGFSVCATDVDRLLITGFGFAHFSEDGGDSWKQIYVDQRDENPAMLPTPKGGTYRGIGLENTSAWWMSWLDPQNIFVSFADIMAIRSEDGGVSWSKDFDAPDYNSVYHSVLQGQIIYAATSSVHDIYQSHRLEDVDLDNGKGAIIYSGDQGKSWDILHDFQLPVIWLAIDPINGQRMYACVVHSSEGGIYMTENLGDGPASNWRRLSSPPRTEGHPFTVAVLNDGTLVATYSARYQNGFTPSSGVFVSQNQGDTWEDRSDPAMHYWTKDLILDPHDAQQNNWYAAVFSGWGGAPNGLGGLYYTENRGQNWERILELDRVESASIHPANRQIMYVSTEYEGLWYTDNLQDNSPAFRLLENYPFQHPTRVFFDPYDYNNVWVASFGNGLRIGQSNLSTALKNNVFKQALNLEVFPNPATEILNIKYELDHPEQVQVWLSDLVDHRITLHKGELQKEGLHLMSFNSDKFLPGVYFLHVKSTHQHQVKKVVLSH